METLAIFLSHPTVQFLLSSLLVAFVCLKLLETSGFLILRSIVALLNPFIILFSMWSGFSFWKRKKTPSLYGDAAWMEKKELKKMFRSKNQGLVLDGASAKMRFTKEQSFRPTLVISPAGGSKSAGFAIPNILKLLEKDSVILCTDPAGELFKNTSGFAQKQGYTVNVLAPDDLKNSLLFNPLSYLDSTDTHFHTDVSKIAHILASSGSTGRGEKIWENGTAEALELGIYAIFQQPKRFRNLGQVRNLLNNFGKRGDSWLNLIAECEDPIQSTWKGFVANDPKMCASFLSGAKSALKPFTNPDLIKLTSEDTCKIQTLRKKKNIWYIIVPESNISYWTWLLQLFYGTVFSTLTRDFNPEEDLDVFMILDEFGNSGRLLSADSGSGGVDSMLTTLRKRRVSISALVQTEKSQINASYGRDAGSTIVEAFQNKLYIGGSHSDETCEALSRRLGSYTVQEKDRKGVKVIRQSPRKLLTADEIRTRPAQSAILVATDHAPIEIKRIQRYFENRSMMKKIKEPVSLNYPSPPETIEFLPLIEEANGRGQIELVFPLVEEEAPPNAPILESSQTQDSDETASAPIS